MKVEIYPKEGLFKKQHPVKECANLIRASDDISWGWFMISPESFAEAFTFLKAVPEKKRIEKSRFYFSRAKKILEQVGV